jgi:hypothetical protein
MFAAVAILCLEALHAADKTLGKLFIKAATSEVNGQQVPDAGLEDSAKDMKARLELRRFVLANNEADADFLLVVLERKGEQVKAVSASFSVKDGGSWKPVAKLTSTNSRPTWSLAARSVVEQAEKWVLTNHAQK